jgi:hypothetical protein
MRPEGHYLKLLSRGDLPLEAFHAILADRAARKYHAVRRALAAHPRTPRREALSLVSTLFWRDLAHLSADSRVHPEIRRTADRDLLRRLPEMAFAERVDLARTVGRGTLILLRLDPDPRILSAVLDNRFATEPDVVQAAARSEATPEILTAIATHRRWSLRPGVRSALLRNRNLPGPLALGLLTRASRDDLEGLLAAHGIPRFLRLCVERVLAQRRHGDYDQNSETSVIEGE